MKIAMVILGVIGSLIALGGSLVTMVGGFGGTAAGTLVENNATATSGAFVFWSGVVAVLVSTVALICSVTGGVAKRRNVIFVFGLATLITGLLNIYLYNWFSGAVIAVGGLLGLIGSKDGIDDQQSVKKSPLFYSVLTVLVLLAAASILIKNGKSFVGSGTNSPAQEASATKSETMPVQSGTAANGGMPFVGSRGFNFYGGAATGQAITIRQNGSVRVERFGSTFGSTGSSVDFEGQYSNPLRMANGSGLLIKNDKIYSVKGDLVEKGCMEDGQECVADLYVIDEPKVSAPVVAPVAAPVQELPSLNLKSALADTSAIVCRYNESEDMCSDVDGKDFNPYAPEDFAAKKGFKAISKREVFDEPGTSASYLKMTVR